MARKFKSLSDQVKAIEGVMNRPMGRQVPDYKFNFGKHRGKHLREVFKKDKKYLEWVYENTDRLSDEIEMFIIRNVLGDKK